MTTGKVTAVAGRNGSGKTQYIEQLRRQLASDKVRYIAFTDSYGVNVDGQYYLQLRWNQHDIDHETPTVGELLEKAFLMAGEDNADRRQLRDHLYRMFHMETLLDKYIITLSSGELRKFQLTKTLFANPSLLIMDNPFIGLDAETRDQLKALLYMLANERDMEIMLVMSKTDDIPAFVSEIKWVGEQQPVPPHVLSDDKRNAILSLPYTDNDYDCQHVIDMRKVTIRYGERTILKDVDWTVRNGERWALAVESRHSSRWYVLTIRRATPATSPSSTVREALARPSGTSSDTSATYRQRCTAPTSATCPPYVSSPAD